MKDNRYEDLENPAIESLERCSVCLYFSGESEMELVGTEEDGEDIWMCWACANHIEDDCHD